MKRRDDEKLDVRAQKCMKTGDSPSLSYDHLLASKSLNKNADFFKNNFDAVISFGDRNLKIRWRLYSGGETENTYLMKIGYWYQILYQEAADGECHFEEKEPSFANFFKLHQRILANFVLTFPIFRSSIYMALQDS